MQMQSAVRHWQSVGTERWNTMYLSGSFTTFADDITGKNLTALVVYTAQCAASARYTSVHTPD